MKRNNFSIKSHYSAIKEKYYAKDKKERNRISILMLSGIMFLNYIMFCYHVESNIFNIFPSIPVIEKKEVINIYIPSEGAMEIISEEREIYQGLSEEILVKKLFSLVSAGSYYENTAINVPVRYIIKKVWITDADGSDGYTCAIDVMPEILDGDISVVENSEILFRKALEKTIVENIPHVKRVILLENGVPFRKLWEI